MSKPICLVKVNRNRIYLNIHDKDIIEDVQRVLEHKFSDYHVLTILSGINNSDSDIELEVFYEKDFEEKDKDYLLNFVKEIMKQYEQDKNKEETSY